MGVYLICILHRCRAVDDSTVAEKVAPRLVKEEMSKVRWFGNDWRADDTQEVRGVGSVLRDEIERRA